MQGSQLPEGEDYSLWLEEAEHRYRGIVEARERGHFSRDSAITVQAVIASGIISVIGDEVALIRNPVLGIAALLLIFLAVMAGWRLMERLLLN